MSAAQLTAHPRLSFNTITAETASLQEVVDACVARGVSHIGPWRHKVAETGLQRSAALIADAGLRVSSLCRGGFFPATTVEGRRRADDDNRKAVEEAAALGTDVLVMVCGPPTGRDLRDAREQIARGLERLLPHAAEHGVRLGIEPLHPMMIGQRSAVVTLGQANDLVELLDADHVGVVVDVYHVFWDPRLEQEIERAAGHLLGFHVCDWLRDTQDTIHERAMMGEGIVDLRGIRRLVEASGYAGPIEVEIINPAIWALPRDELMATVCERFAAHVMQDDAPPPADAGSDVLDSALERSAE